MVPVGRRRPVRLHPRRRPVPEGPGQHPRPGPPRRPPGRLGPKWTTFAPQLNPLVWQVASQFVTSFEGFRRPWAELERAVPGLWVEEAYFGCVYLAWGRLPSNTGPVRNHVHLTDLAGLAGQHLGYSGWHDITQDDVSRFAALTDDEQWIHVDPERAADGPFGATVAHGFHTLARFTSCSGSPGRRRGRDHPELRRQPRPVPGPRPGRQPPPHGPRGQQRRAGRRRHPGRLQRHLRGRRPAQASLRGRGDLPVLR